MQATHNPDTSNFPLWPLALAAIAAVGIGLSGQHKDLSVVTPFAYPDSVSTGEFSFKLPPPVKGIREYHPAANSGKCDGMAERFARQGRRVKLVKKVRLTGSNFFQSICVFEGGDADPEFFSSDPRNN